MSMSWWWIAFAVVVLLALVAAVADGRGRGGRGPGGRRGGSAGARSGGRPGGRTRPPAGPGREPGPERRPRPGEIWWAEVPYEDGPGTKDRPCLVLSVRGDSALVAKITSKHHEERPGVIALPAGAVGDARGRASFLETDELREVALRGFRRLVGVVDAGVWERVRKLG
ncbi:MULTISPECIES: type II toxin-antitoxin system PemK/MazF family toxin [unclassified Streptomyces]|uniref:type II toxin-antitoxin system PemK/MazF family toxin n=1 Tax=unclassified Streptomyces TaxID=2593676 RepID=UPI0022580B62|nr:MULTISPECIES: type II toxin-antitoxin system PemK/MazF family toxin [unclassified Streptomyces]WSP55297.1 type II toxin-antitoxin system PemK/MazF family toxin [Streptomyces sp. NBC_01241]MCX4786973.1 type II toxin-antitoxin system PemK/MazF family toxin [Streptomyces sp. NBC_01221]MCX4797245.1 type II toxin-antitoxin system PemK/MazF family toxin [Streptomyces sp. NBC_01242]WSJ38536.1 type II toxin-antitoxin system PemK/MazF family toxin [Streptomyces sp. NBC_01321]WSP64824.1 type II toxin